MKAEGAVCVGEIDAKATNAVIDLRGGVHLSEGAQAKVGIRWNGKMLKEEVIGNSAAWTVSTRFPVSAIRRNRHNHLQITMELKRGNNPAMDLLSLDSVDFLWAAGAGGGSTNSPARQ